MEKGTFYNCSNLSNINIPDNIEYIGDEAFAMTSLTNIALPDSITYIGENAFNNLKENSVIYCQSQAVADLVTQSGTNATVIVDASKF